MHLLFAFTMFWSLECCVVQTVGGQQVLRKSTSEWALLKILGPSPMLSLIVFCLEPSGLNNLPDSYLSCVLGCPTLKHSWGSEMSTLGQQHWWDSQEYKRKLKQYSLAWNFVRPSDRELLPLARLLQGTAVTCLPIRKMAPNYTLLHMPRQMLPQGLVVAIVGEWDKKRAITLRMIREEWGHMNEISIFRWLLLCSYGKEYLGFIL